jgi:hypothetical protein
MSITLSQKVRFKPDVLVQQVGGEIVLLNLESEAYFGLDEVGARMMNLLNEGNSPAEVVDKLLQEYEVDRETLTQDLLALVEECLTHGLLEIVEP